MLYTLYTIVFSQWTVLFVVGAYLFYKWSTANYKFFLDKGIPFRKPIPFFGNFSALVFRTGTFHDFVLSSYMEFKDKRYFGLYEFRKPLLAIRDREILKQITVKDFEHFLDHRATPFTEDAEPLFGKSLFLLKGQKWREMRSTLSPAFTGSKMRQMFQLVVECAEEATKILLKESLESTKPYVPEMKDLFTRFTNDVIASSAFGIQVNSLQNRENKFYKMGKKSTNFGVTAVLKIVLMGVFPKLCKALGIRVFDGDQTEFYRSLVHDTMKHREREGIIRPDMIQLLMEARKGSLRNDNEKEANEGFATVEEVSSEQLRGTQKRVWTDDDLTAQCFLFFLAGFETSATLMCFMAHEITENRDVQAKLLLEVDEVRKQLDGKSLTYDVLQKMKYLDMVVSESLRKWPPAIATDRACLKRYEITEENGSTITINEGDSIWIPIYGIHRDPEYYPDPEKFDPERFSDENKDKIFPFSFIPFGAGPRNCIGSRFALMECKAFIFYLLSTFTFEIAETTQIPLKMAISGFTIKAEKGFNVHLKPRK